jgi:hypothetical protein
MPVILGTRENLLRLTGLAVAVGLLTCPLAHAQIDLLHRLFHLEYHWLEGSLHV